MTHRSTGRRRAFTLVELLVVILIIAILLALLVPAIVGAIRTAKASAVTTEINGLAASLAQFKTAYNDFPPSRMYLNESGFYPVANTTSLATAIGSDITVGQLAQRSLQYLKKFWPRVVFSTSAALFTVNTAPWHDFDGDGALTIGPAPGGGYVIQGHQCLVFFLGGIPYNTQSGIGMSGFGRNPANPFTNMIVGSANYRGGTASTGTPSSTQPLFDFAANRLMLDPTSACLIPGYVDSLGNTLQTSPPDTAINFYAYFSSYGSAYDPNDVNFDERDNTGATTTTLATNVGFACVNSGGTSTGAVCQSPAPNPYTSSLTTRVQNGFAQPTVFEKPITFQIISAGVDGKYGIGGQWTSQGENHLPFDANGSNVADPGIRQREGDNLSNFTTGKLSN